MIEGVLFDMDGVLLDSEKYINRAAVLMFKEKGFQVLPEDFLPFTGMGENRYLGGVAEKYGIPFDVETDKKRTYEIYEDIVKGNIAPLPGVYDFIEKCRSKNLKLAVATSADFVKMVINLKEIGLPVSAFDATVNGLETSRLKPAPDIFILAAERLALKPEKCLVVEDALSGIKAAKAAGARALGLTTTFSAQELIEVKADWTAPNLSKASDEVLSW